MSCLAFLFQASKKYLARGVVPIFKSVLGRLAAEAHAEAFGAELPTAAVRSKT